MSPACPHLPPPGRVFTHEDLQALGRDRGPAFHDTALHCAQSLILAGFPAKALLMINRALSCRLEEVRLDAETAHPYRAVAWILAHRREEEFIGNPRRHFQHLATRMVEPHKDLRVWRAWACWYLARRILPESGFPPDLKQIRQEQLVEPVRGEIEHHLGRLTPADDVAAWKSALADCERRPAPSEPGCDIREIGPSEIAEVARLAHEIWPQVYPSIISGAQIEYMLATGYSLEKLTRDLERPGMHYALIRDASGNAGYLAWETSEADRSGFIHKLYLLPRCHGQGLGARALEWIADAARTAGLERLRLRVNRGNAPAIRAYLRAGFSFEADLCSDIGGGFVMDDFVLSRRLTGA